MGTRSTTSEMAAVIGADAEPGPDCPRCPRLVAFRQTWRAKEPGWFNAPVPSFGPVEARLLIVGLAPGLRGANRTGRPFTGDFAGQLLYATLKEFDFARGDYAERADDGLALVDARIANAVRCVPPENKPLGAEITTCRKFLTGTIARFANLNTIVTLGAIAHQSVVRSLGVPLRAAPFRHGALHRIGALAVVSSYHCSRYNTNTGVLTAEMFRALFARVRAHLDAASQASTSAAL